MKASRKARLIAWLLKLVNFKKIIEKSSSKLLNRKQRNFIPNGIHRKYKVRSKSLDNALLATLEGSSNAAHQHIIFLHGGAYIFRANSGHWNFIAKIKENLGCNITMVDYPLAPDHNYKAVFESLDRTYDYLLNTYPNDTFIFMGDSAGAGLALTFSQKLMLEKQTKLPEKLILFSPWLDLSLSNPDMKKQEESDHILTIKMLENAANYYADGADKKQYLLSPINGNFDDLPQTLLFYGSEELFFADCEKLKTMLQPENTKVTFRLYPEMQHDWAILPIPEQKQVIREVIEFLTKD